MVLHIFRFQNRLQNTKNPKPFKTWDADTGGGVAPYWTVSASAFMGDQDLSVFLSGKEPERGRANRLSFVMVDYHSFAFSGPVSALSRKSGKTISPPWRVSLPLGFAHEKRWAHLLLAMGSHRFFSFSFPLGFACNGTYDPCICSSGSSGSGMHISRRGSRLAPAPHPSRKGILDARCRRHLGRRRAWRT